MSLVSALDYKALEDALEKASDAIMIVEKPVYQRLVFGSPSVSPMEYRVVFSNSMFSEISGLKRREVVGKPVSIVLPKHEKMTDSLCFLKTCGVFDSFREQTRLECVDGLFELEIYPARRSLDGADRKIILLKRIFDDKDEKNSLKPKRMRVSKRLISDLSHEIRTPLNAIIGFSELMQSKAMGELAGTKYDDYLQDIVSSGRDLLLTLTSIMELTRYEQGHITDEAMESDVSEAIKFVSVETLAKVGAVEIKIRHLGFEKPLLVKVEQLVLERILSWVIGFLVRLSEKDGAVLISRKPSENGRMVMQLDIATPLSLRATANEKAENNEFTCNDEENSFNLFLARRFLRIFGGYLEVSKTAGNDVTGIRLHLPEIAHSTVSGREEKEEALV